MVVTRFIPVCLSLKQFATLNLGPSSSSLGSLCSLSPVASRILRPWVGTQAMRTELIRRKGKNMKWLSSPGFYFLSCSVSDIYCPHHPTSTLKPCQTTSTFFIIRIFQHTVRYLILYMIKLPAWFCHFPASFVFLGFLTLFLKFLFDIGVYLIYNVLLVSDVQQSDLAIHMHMLFSHQVLSNCFCDSKDCSLPGSVHGIFQARILEVGCYFLPQGIFLTQGSNPHLLLGKQVLYQ